ncbi:TetR/AcrR family transcriptional regulator [Jiangella endophytica]|uniref:TetR/AcrR family transcriptional regulator n=1 Tax=Jiangella endophytica TaxID=1623398 RepID=UPI001300A586|nr:TetR/AcrR family transcriptional regulator [Jiangella endophytica]
MSDLRARRHLATRGEIVEAGLRLFDERGYDAVTMEQIASAAGVSRRTLYRHFPTKDRILLDLPVEWMTMWDEVVDDVEADLPARAVIERAARVIGERLDAESTRIRTAWRIIDAVPALEAAFLANPAWIARVVTVFEDPARGAALDRRTAVVVAGAYLGALDAAMMHWAAGGGDGTVTDAVELILDRLAPIWT